MEGVVLIFIGLGMVFYFLPTIIAFIRKKPNAPAIFALNFFLGWSLVGWVVSLVWALTTDNPGLAGGINVNVTQRSGSDDNISTTPPAQP